MEWALVPGRFMADPFPDTPTLFGSMFMHAGWMHLGANMFYLWLALSFPLRGRRDAP